MNIDANNLRQEMINRYFSRLNEMQLKAVTHVSGPLLILAGAGSGKTTVIVNRIAYILRFGHPKPTAEPLFLTEEQKRSLETFLAGGELPEPSALSALGVRAARPWEILAITFTNKAAGELKERLARMLGPEGEEIWASTFHSTCARMLRRYGERLGYTSRFTIYDTDDSRRLMKECQKQLNIDDKTLPHRSILAEIGRQKDQLISPEQYLAETAADARKQLIGKAYALYQKRLKEADAMDFDDLLVNTVRLLTDHPDVLDYYQNRFKYILIDEYQDTNHAQYVFAKLLAGGHRNICVVGDDDQSIYKFRGATIENILNFEKQYPDATVIRLEENYRSTGVILEAANEVIKNNQYRKGKTLWTRHEQGDLIRLEFADNEWEEARYIADTVLEGVRAGRKFSDFAVLYRMNAQSNTVENMCARSGIPYRIVGGQRFYDRREVKDVLAYLCVLCNPTDSLRLKRIVNVPRRGIGDTTVENAQRVADNLGISLFEVFQKADEFAPLSRAAGKLMAFAALIQELMEYLEENGLHSLLETLLRRTGYLDALMLEEDGEDRVSNVSELSSSVLRYEQENEDATLAGFLEEVALITDLDNYDSRDDRLVMMTFHSAKGLEFPVVFMVGMEENLFPSSMTVMEGPGALEEERRLAYVGITRAREELHLTCARERVLHGKTTRNFPSRFLREIPSRLLRGTVPAYSAHAGGAGGYGTGTAFGRTGSFPERKETAFGYSAAAPVPKQEAPKTVWKAGDRVVHRTFGTGEILSAQVIGNDTMLEICFEKVGIKKLMANFARLEKQ